MHARLHDLALSLESDDPSVLTGWQALFDIEEYSPSEGGTPVDFAITATAVSQTPPPPDGRPSYIDPTPENGRRVRFYDTESGGILDLARPAQIHFDFQSNQAQIFLTKSIVDTGNLEDVTMIALAPFLRRRGFYLAHAFAVAGRSAVLLSGPTGSGKTTTGLAFIQTGAGYLANDVTLLRAEGGLISAYPSPGAINLHPDTLTLLPEYTGSLSGGEAVEKSGKVVLRRSALLDGHQLGRPSPVSAILFPAITGQAHYALYDLPAAIGMARLVEEGVDQWDSETYEDHISFLAALSRQVHFYDLRLPRSDTAGLRSVAGELALQLL